MLNAEFRMINKKKYLLLSLTLALLTAGALLYVRFISPTRIAFVNFEDWQYTGYLHANDNPFIRVTQLSIEPEHTPPFSRYDMVFLFGMGLRLTDTQRAALEKAGSRGVGVYTYGGTTAEASPTNLTEEHCRELEHYFTYGGTINARRMFNYCRKVFDRKSFFTESIRPPGVIPQNALFHCGEQDYFESVTRYREFYRSRGLFKPGAPSVCVLTSNLSPRLPSTNPPIHALVRELERRGLNVYPVTGFFKRLEYLKQIEPDVIVFIAHGRLAPGRSAQAREVLKQLDAPLLCPVIVHQPYDEWLESQKGMVGGMMAQNIVVPEIDGGVAPYAIGAQFPDKQGHLVFKPIPGRVETFSRLVHNYARLERTPAGDKRIAVVYYKGPGRNAMIASGLEVAPSLLNLLQHLRDRGYRTGALPADADELTELIQRRGCVPSPYAEGAIEKLINEGEPELIPADTLSAWMHRGMPPEMVRAVEKQYGQSPGDLYTVTDSTGTRFLALPRLIFGNVAVIPQLMPGLGDNTFKLVHGVKRPPPYPYVATYLWIREGFEADALIHFGTHGSLEFTPWRQPPLSRYDWSDALLGPMPHFYVYVVDNVGEAIIAKRRGYATILTHLTPPFKPAGTYGDLRLINDKINAWYGAANPRMRAGVRRSIGEMFVEAGLHKDLNLEHLAEREPTPEELDRIVEYVQTIGREKITDGLYTWGEPYTEGQMRSTVGEMCVDVLAHTRARLDAARGVVSRDSADHSHVPARRYREWAYGAIDRVLADTAALSDFVTPAIRDTLQRLRRMKRRRERYRQECEVRDRQRATYPDIAGDSAASTRITLIYHVSEVFSDSGLLEVLQSWTHRKQFAWASSLLNPDSMQQAIKVARAVPEIRATVSRLRQPPLQRLLRRMQEPDACDFVMHLLRDSTDRARAFRRILPLARDVRQCLTRGNRHDLHTALDSGRLRRFLRHRTDPARLDTFEQNCLRYLRMIPRAPLLRHESDSGARLAKLLTAETTEFRLREALRATAEALTSLEDSLADFRRAVADYCTTFTRLPSYYHALSYSPGREIDALVDKLHGRYCPPCTGGDPILNPASLPTGRNMYGINPEKAPGREAWRLGRRLADELIAEHRAKTGTYPRKVALTLWGGEFIRGRGSTVAQILALLGTEPVMNARGDVHDVKLVPAKRLQRPRIDVVVQTSGQFRDIAPSRIFLINKAVKLASEARDTTAYANFVVEGNRKAEELLKRRGLSPREARDLARVRVFGERDGRYGSGVRGMVQTSGSWSRSDQIAGQYLMSMGALYTEDKWGTFKQGAFEAALQNTDAVAHSLTSHTFGPLSLDHIYAFMGGVSAAVKRVTGNEPAAYFIDERDPRDASVEDAREMIRREARSSILNPAYIRPLLDGDASSAETFAETFRNTFGWSALRHSAIGSDLWDLYHKTYVRDIHELGIREFFDKQNPYAYQAMTAILLEAHRKGFWKTTPNKVRDLARLHTHLVEKHRAGCSVHVCNNEPLRQLIRKQLPEKLRDAYAGEMKRTLEPSEERTLQLQRVDKKKPAAFLKDNLRSLLIIAGIIVLVIATVAAGSLRQRH